MYTFNIYVNTGSDPPQRRYQLLILFFTMKIKLGVHNNSNHQWERYCQCHRDSDKNEPHNMYNIITIILKVLIKSTKIKSPKIKK